MYQRASHQNYISAVAWVLLGLAMGLHFPDVDGRLKWLIPTWLLLHRSILTHGLIASLLLFLAVRRRGGEGTALRLFVIGVSLAVAVHLCFDFFPRGWAGFALIHVPVYGRTTALFSQTWLILSILSCLYAAFLLVRNVVEFALSIGSLLTSFVIHAAEEGRVVLSALL